MDTEREEGVHCILLNREKKLIEIIEEKSLHKYNGIPEHLHQKNRLSNWLEGGMRVQVLLLHEI